MPLAASESTCSEKRKQAGAIFIAHTVWMTRPPVVEPMVTGRHSAFPVRHFPNKSALF